MAGVGAYVHSTPWVRPCYGMCEGLCDIEEIHDPLLADGVGGIRIAHLVCEGSRDIEEIHDPLLADGGGWYAHSTSLCPSLLRKVCGFT